MYWSTVMKSMFLVMSDTHFCLPGLCTDDTWWNRCFYSRSEEIAESIIATTKKISPDFVIHCGDFSNHGDIESFKFGRSVVESLPCPCYFVPGNHDGYLSGTRSVISSMFGLSNGILYQTKRIGKLCFIFLDCAYWITKSSQIHDHIDWDLHKSGDYENCGPTPEELTWLEEELKNNADCPSVIVTHMPIFSKSTYSIGKLPKGKAVKSRPSPYTDIEDYGIQRGKISPIINNSLNVKLVLTGHWHIFDLSQENSIYHCQTGSLVEYPFEMRLFHVEGNKMSATTVGLSNQKLREESYVTEWQNSWVAGKRKDREFVIDLA